MNQLHFLLFLYREINNVRYSDLSDFTGFISAAFTDW